MGIVVVLQPYRGSKIDTVTQLETLLAEAKSGGLIGVAYVAMRQPSSYTIGIAGETRRSPTYTRGMLCRLDDELASLLVRPPA